MKPIIGIQAQINDDGEPFIGEGYMEFISEAGGEPELFNPVKDAAEAEAIVEKYDGILIPGGDDIDPRLYGEGDDIDPEKPFSVRDISEPLLLAAIREIGTPFLGICRGCQMAQVQGGGKLYRDIAAELPKAERHWQDPPYDRPAHHIVLVTDSPIGGAALDINIWGPQGVNSLHHQAIKRPFGKDLEMLALGSDMVIEGVFIREHPFFAGIQWHPELMRSNRVSKVIAKTFVEAAEMWAATRVAPEEESAPAEGPEITEPAETAEAVESVEAAEAAE